MNLYHIFTYWIGNFQTFVVIEILNFFVKLLSWIPQDFMFDWSASMQVIDWQKATIWTSNDQVALIHHCLDLITEQWPHSLTWIKFNSSTGK